MIYAIVGNPVFFLVSIWQPRITARPVLVPFGKQKLPNGNVADSHGDC